MPYLQNPRFTGRDQELEQIVQCYERQSSERSGVSRSIGLYGPGGIGKTQIAIAYAFESSRQKQYSAIFWASALSRQRLLDDYQKIATHILGQFHSTDHETVAQVVKRELDRGERVGNWLLIVDNADDYDIIKDLIPISGRDGTILLTTRSLQIAKAQSRNAFEVLTLPEQTAAQFLVDVSGSHQSALPTALEVARELGHFPLAMEQSAAYVRETGGSLASYLVKFRARKREMLGRFPKEAPAAVQYYKETVSTTWSLSIRTVETKNRGAMKLLNLLCFFSSTDIPERLLRDGNAGLPSDEADLQEILEDSIAFDETVLDLLNFSLVRRLNKSESLWVHPLVQEIIRAKLEKAKLEHHYALCMVKIVSEAFPADGEDVADWPTCRRYLPHALLCQRYSAFYGLRSEEIAALFCSAVFYLKEIGCLNLSLLLGKSALEIRHGLLGADHLHTAQSMNDVGLIYWRLEENDNAERLLEEVRVIRERQLGLRHYLTGWTLHGLGLVSRQRGKCKKAQEFYELSLSILSEALGHDHPRVAFVIHDLGVLWQSQCLEEHGISEPESLERTVTYLTEALRIRRSAVGVQHPDTARTLHCLAIAHFQQNKIELAIKELIDVKRVHETTSPLHFENGYNSQSLAMIYKSKGLVSEAQVYLSEAVTIFDGTFGPLHPKTVEANIDLALCNWTLGNHENAENLCCNVLRTLNEEILSRLNAGEGLVDCSKRNTNDFQVSPMLSSRRPANRVFREAQHCKLPYARYNEYGPLVIFLLMKIYSASRRIEQFITMAIDICHFAVETLVRYTNVLDSLFSTIADVYEGSTKLDEKDELVEALRQLLIRVKSQPDSVVEKKKGKNFAANRRCSQLNRCIKERRERQDLQR
jgi:tetratricopeptide (TPR) repeat protein